jgi:hypothetical protein
MAMGHRPRKAKPINMYGKCMLLHVRRLFDR